MKFLENMKSFTKILISSEKIMKLEQEQEKEDMVILMI